MSLPESPQFLFKYRRMADRGYIGSIKFSSPKSFNDIYETMPNDIDGVDKVTKESLNSQCIFCTSMTSENNAMWGNYADSHKGFCIVYLKYKLLNIAKEHCLWHGPVYYSNRKRTKDIGSYYPYNECANIPSSVLLQFTKDKDWSYEEEYRFVSGIILTEEDPYHVIDDIKDCIYCIIFGCKADEKEMKSFMQGHPDLHYFQAEPSQSHYMINSYANYLELKDGEIAYGNKKSAETIKKRLDLKHYYLPKSSFKYALAQARRGIASAMRETILNYSNGYGVEKDIRKAIKWLKELEKEAKKKNSEAMYNLGLFYSCENDLCNINHEKAVEWFTKAAAKNHPEAMNRVKV